MTRAAHHRAAFRTGPHHTWLQRKARHLHKLFLAILASRRMARSMRPVGPGIYAIPQADRLAWLIALEDAVPYAVDETGEVWK